MEKNLEHLKNELDDLEKKLEVEIDGRAELDELEKLRKDIQEIKDEITKMAKQ